MTHGFEEQVDLVPRKCVSFGDHFTSSERTWGSDKGGKLTETVYQRHERRGACHYG